MTNKTITEIKGKYSELIDCLAPERSNYRSDINKLVQDCKEELHAKYDALIKEVNEAAKDVFFLGMIEVDTKLRAYLAWDLTTFDSEFNYELSVILGGNE